MTNATPAPGLPADAEALDFVYCGRRLGTAGYLIDCICPLKKDGALAPERLFKGERAERVVGGIYTGCSFTDGACYGLKGARFTGSKWTKDRPLLVAWEAKSIAAKAELASERLEKDERKQGVIEEAMLPLRELYRSALMRGDYSTASALERAVLVALKHPPPKK